MTPAKRREAMRRVLDAIKRGPVSTKTLRTRRDRI